MAEAYGVPKHSFGYRFITESPTGFVINETDATRILGSVFEPFLYKLNATKPDLAPRRICAHSNWQGRYPLNNKAELQRSFVTEKLQVTSVDGSPTGAARDGIPAGPACPLYDCSCYMRYSDACPMTGYKTYYLPVPWWWCYYNCQVVKS